MANYAVTNSTAIGSGNVQQAMAATYKSLITIGNSSAVLNTFFTTGAYRRGKLYDLLIGTNGTPADNFMEFDVEAITLGTTPTAWTAAQSVSSVSSNFATDPADFAFNSAMGINSTNETGIAAIAEKWYVGINQRASYRWVAAPGSEILYPAISSALQTAFTYNGLSLRARSGAYTGTATGSVLVSEQ